MGGATYSKTEKPTAVGDATKVAMLYLDHVVKYLNFSHEEEIDFFASMMEKCDERMIVKGDVEQTSKD